METRHVTVRIAAASKRLLVLYSRSTRLVTCTPRLVVPRSYGKIMCSLTATASSLVSVVLLSWLLIRTSQARLDLASAPISSLPIELTIIVTSAPSGPAVARRAPPPPASAPASSGRGQMKMALAAARNMHLQPYNCNSGRSIITFSSLVGRMLVSVVENTPAERFVRLPATMGLSVRGATSPATEALNLVELQEFFLQGGK
mmetsp:Transcript_13629/g.29657  ORF Transcript_13629/g.29657 Transcript_13629/m.29657 type:complete len:202 (+) Transcript_13629:402-1007(+)